MKTLFIDTHLWDIRIVLFENGIVVDKCEVINKKNNSEYIFPSIVKIIDNIKLDQIIVVNGPGSFTGVRLGVTIAKTLAYTLNIPIKTVTSLECLAVSNMETSVAISDGNGYYIGLFDKEMSLLEDYTYINNDAFDKYKNSHNIILTENLDYERIFDFVVKNKEDENPHAVKPIYVKKIGVENG